VATNRRKQHPNTNPLTTIMNDGKTPTLVTVALPESDWQQIIGMLEQGTSVILSQLALQQGGLKQVADLSTIATKHIDAIKKQVG